MWMQPAVAPPQSTMDVDKDEVHPKDIKSSLSTKKKNKGKAKALEMLIHQQQVEEAEETLNWLLQHVESAEVNPEVAHLVEYDEAMVTVVEGLLTCIDMLRSEKCETEQALIKEENKRMMLQDEISCLKDRKQDEPSKQEDEEHYQKKRKE